MGEKDDNTLQEKIGKSLQVLNKGLRVFILQVVQRVYGHQGVMTVYQAAGIPVSPSAIDLEELDTRSLLQCLTKLWTEVFHPHSNLEHQHKAIAHELRQVRNEWAHQKKINLKDAYRALV